MTRNPFYNALFAIAYIMVLVTCGFLAPLVVGQMQSMFVPMGMLGLLVISVALMAYLFFYQPVIMLIEGQREKAVKLFLQTVGIFAGATAVILIVSIFVA